ncbi:MAG: dihydropteroate synthase [Anaerolineaceae bacterium]|nr:dihydropteroate synthase [Anaerolineaceae bacterium]
MNEKTLNTLPVWGEKTLLMGILNITPDSFSGDGLISKDAMQQAVLTQAQVFVDGGADILDIGGESTRPGAAIVSAQEELDRVVPVLEWLKEAELDVILSVDTYKAAVADAALQAGAHWVNDVWGLRADPDMAGVVAKANAPVVLMHNRSQPQQVEVRERLGGSYGGAEYNDLLQDVCDDLMQSVQLAHNAGIPDEHIILDPGIGFGKTVEQNLQLIKHLDRIRVLGYPVLMGPSRKSFIGYTLDLPVDQRFEGSASAVVVGMMQGADIIRVHDVAQMARVIKMTDAIMRVN